MNNPSHIVTRFMLAPSAHYDSTHSVRVRSHLKPSLRLKQAAVLIPLVPRPEGFNVVFTSRAKHLKHHPGQVSFPGGRKEPQDVDLIDTAIRETYEETGILCTRDNIIGHLPALPTISGYMVTPYLGLVSPHYRPELDFNEVEELFEAPLDYVLNPMNMRTQKVSVQGKGHNIYSVPYQKYAIWGATAQMLKVLSKQLWY